jgi:hypothetical protein
VAGVLVAASLTACGGGGSSSGGTGIVLAHGYTDAEATALKAAASEWNTQHPDEKVSLQFNGGNDGALQKTVAGFTAGNYPDAGRQPQPRLQQEAVRRGSCRAADQQLDVGRLPHRRQEAHRRQHEDLRVGLCERRQ